MRFKRLSVQDDKREGEEFTASHYFCRSDPNDVTHTSSVAGRWQESKVKSSKGPKFESKKIESKKFERTSSKGQCSKGPKFERNKFRKEQSSKGTKFERNKSWEHILILQYSNWQSTRSPKWQNLKIQSSKWAKFGRNTDLN